MCSLALALYYKHVMSGFYYLMMRFKYKPQIINQKPPPFPPSSLSPFLHLLCFVWSNLIISIKSFYKQHGSFEILTTASNKK